MIWNLLFCRKDPVEEIADAAENEVDKIDDGPDMSDHLNKLLRND